MCMNVVGMDWNVMDWMEWSFIVIKMKEMVQEGLKHAMEGEWNEKDGKMEVLGATSDPRSAPRSACG